MIVLILYVFAFVLFVLAGLGLPSPPRVSAHLRMNTALAQAK